MIFLVLRRRCLVATLGRGPPPTPATTMRLADADALHIPASRLCARVTGIMAEGDEPDAAGRWDKVGARAR